MNVRSRQAKNNNSSITYDAYYNSEEVRKYFAMQYLDVIGIMVNSDVLGRRIKWNPYRITLSFVCSYVKIILMDLL